MIKKRNLFYAFVIFLAISQHGCSYTASFNRSPYINQSALQQYLTSKQKKSPEEIILMKEFPKQSFVVLGTLHAPEVEWTAHYTTDQLINAMRKKAAELGADAIVDFRFRENPTIQTVGSFSVTPSGGTGVVTAVPYKGLHAWGDVIIFVPEEKKKLIEP